MTTAFILWTIAVAATLCTGGRIAVATNQTLAAIELLARFSRKLRDLTADLAETWAAFLIRHAHAVETDFARVTVGMSAALCADQLTDHTAGLLSISTENDIGNAEPVEAAVTVIAHVGVAALLDATDRYDASGRSADAANVRFGAMSLTGAVCAQIARIFAVLLVTALVTAFPALTIRTANRGIAAK